MNTDQLGKNTRMALTALLDAAEQEHGLRNGRTACYWHLNSVLRDHIVLDRSDLEDGETRRRLNALAEERGWKSL